MIRKERFPAGKKNLRGKVHLDVTHFATFLINLVLTNSHIFIFQVEMSTPVNNLMNTFRWILIEVYDSVLFL